MVVPGLMPTVRSRDRATEADGHRRRHAGAAVLALLEGHLVTRVQAELGRRRLPVEADRHQPGNDP